jgi:hypothetical protein
MPRRAILAVLLAACAPLALNAAPPTSHAAAFTNDGLIKADVATLPDTQLVAHPDVPLKPTDNLIWCGTLQLAWNEAIKLVGEKLQFTTQPPVVDLLNRQDFTRADLNPDCYVAIANFERNHVEDQIRAALEKVFHGAASPELIPPIPDHPGPYDFVAYAYLFKNLQFPQVFQENDPLNFGPANTAVKSFGFAGETKHKLPPGVFGQVKIYDYQGPDDFIISLKTGDPQDQLILAKVTPSETLRGTIAAVLSRINQGKMVIARQRDDLSIPKLNYDLTRNFTDLEGLTLKPGPNTPVKNLVTREVKQLVRFQLNEKGAVLKSEAVIAVAMGIAMPLDQHEMIFDKPFLILMKQANASQPYFAMWVGNASLLIPAN